MKKLIPFLSLIAGLLLTGNNALAQSPTVAYAGSPYTFTVGTAITSFGPTTSTGVTGSFAGTTTFATGAFGSTYGVVTYDPVSGNFYAVTKGDLDKISSTGVITAINTTTLNNANSGTGIVTDGLGNIYVSDDNNNNVVEFNSTGTVIRTITGFTTPNGLAVDASNNVYVADAGGAGNIYKIPAGVVNTKTTLLTTFTAPYGIAINTATGDMYVTQNGGSNATRTITKIANAVGGGTTKTTFVAGGSGFTGQRNLTFDSFGDLFLVDGTTVKMISSTGTVTTALSGLTNPGEVDFDPSGNMYIADGGQTIKESLVTYYQISPGLPASLSFNTTTGVISGTPTAASAQTTYTITAHNTSGTGTTTIKITCVVIAPALTYASQTYTYGTAVSYTPANSGGAPATCSTSPALPAGLSIVNTTGAITGTPTTIAASNTYTVTSINSGGTTTTSVTIVVNPASLTITATGPPKTYGTGLTAGPGANFSITSGTVFVGTVTSVTLTPDAAGVSSSTPAGTAYTVTPNFATGTGGFSAANYNITYNAFTGTVAPKTLTVTASPQTKPYGTTFTFAGTEFTTSGLLFSDAVTGATISSTGSAVTATVAGGPYTINISGATGSGLSNYTIGYTAGSMTISKVGLSITANPQTKVYGSTFTFSGVQVSTSGLLNSDAVTGTTMTCSGSVATATVAGSPYAIVPSAATGTGMTNYNITYNNGAMTVTPFTLTITALNQSRAFGITTNYTVSYSTFPGTETAANLTAPPAVSGPPVNSPVGTYTNQLIPSGAVDPNYTFVYVDGTLTITAAATSTYDWTGISNTLWENPLNWSIGGVQQTFAYPGSTDNADVVDVGVNTAIPVITNFPVISAVNLTIASLTFGYNNAPQNTTGGTLGLTVNTFTLAVTGAILQQHSSTGNSGGLGATANGIVTTLQGSGFITCTSFTVGDNTLPANFGNTITRVNIGGSTASTLSVTVNGNLTMNSASQGFFIGVNANDAYISQGAGILTVTGTIQLTNFVTGFSFFNPFGNPYSKFSMDLNSTNSPVLNLQGATPISIATTANTSNVVDFNNPGTGAKTGIVNYYAFAGTQKIYTTADANFDTSPAVYSALTLNNPASKIVDGGTLSTSSDFTTSGGVVNLNSNNPAVTIGGNWTNSTTVTEGTGTVAVTGNLANNSGGTITGSTTTATTTITGSVTNNGTITCNKENMTFNGNYTNNLTFTAGTGTVSFTGGSAQALQDNSTTGTTFNNVTFGSTGAKTMSATGSGFFSVSSTGLLTMSGTATLAAGGVLTLRSNASGSASVAQITTTNPITGNVNVERFITGGPGFRSYRLLSSPVSTSLNSGVISMNYLINSCYITGTTGTAGGFDFSLINNPSLYLFRENMFGTNGSFTSGNFRGVNDLNTGGGNPPVYGIDVDGPNFTVYNGNGYLFFFRGDRSLASLATEGTTYVPTNTTLTATGALIQGQVKVKHWFGGSTTLWETTLSGSINTEGFNLVGNPYASSINWDTYSATTSSNGIYAPGVASFLYILMPNGNYNTYAANAAGGLSTGGIPNSNVIPSGQGFFVQATGASPSITFNESAKTTAQVVSGVNLFMGAPPVAAVSQYLHLLLSKNSVNEDGILVNFNNNARAQYIPGEDAPYKTGSGPASLNSFSADNIALAINTLPLPKQSPLVIPLNVGANVNGSYQLTMAALNSIPAIYQVWLMDAYKKDSLDFRHNSVYSFDINRSIAASYGAGRFSIVIRQDPASGVRLLSFNATKATKGVQTVWTTENEQNYTNFTLERSLDEGKTFNDLDGFISTGAGTYSFLDKTPHMPSDRYRLKLVDLNGAIRYSNVVTINYSGSPDSQASNNISVYPNPARSVINLEITQNSGLSSNLSALGKLNANPGLVTPGTGSQSYDIKIINITGFVVKTAVSQQPNWGDNVSGLQPGTYIIQVLNNKDKSLVGKATFIKL